MTRRLHKTANRAACETCGVPAFELCADSKGNTLQRCHPARVAADRAIPPITAEQLDALDAILDYPAKVLHPSVAAALKREPKLIVAIDPPVPPNPSGRHQRYRARRHQLTPAGFAIRVATGRCCADRVAFLDGELVGNRADAFRAHLTGCERCRDGLVLDVALGSQLSTLTTETRQ